MSDPSRTDVTREQAEEAVRTLLRWAGEDPAREGLLDTPKRVVKAYRDWFSGYDEDPGEYLRRTFEEVEGYDELVVLRGIEFESHCEHHMAPIIGRAHVGYLPTARWSASASWRAWSTASRGASRCRKSSPRRSPTASQDTLQPRGVGVVIDASHECMTTRGVHKRGVSMVTSQMLGTFREDARTRAEFLRFIDIDGGTLMRAALATVAALACCWRPCVQRRAPSTISAYLRLFDTNGDGRVSLREYQAHMSARLRRHGSQQRRHHRSGRATARPASPRRRSPRASIRRNLAAAFHRQDTNHDGFLDARELAAPPR